jgi:uncharacterized cupredoxin-like copper-binding protein
MKTMKKLFAACAVLMIVAGCATSQTAPTTTTSVATTTTVAPAPLDVEVIVGENSGDERIEVVALGDEVRITLVNPTKADEYHLHGYDIATKKMEPGAPATLTFTANVAGTFELESHVTQEVLVTLEIS